MRQESAEMLREDVAHVQRMVDGKVPDSGVAAIGRELIRHLMMAADEILKTFADNQSIYYLDLVPLMTPVGDNWKGLSADHLHPDAAGYQLWTDAMMPLLNKLLPPPVAAPQP